MLVDEFVIGTGETRSVAGVEIQRVGGGFSRKIRVTIWHQEGTSTSTLLRPCARCRHCFSPAWMRTDTLWASAMERNSRRRNTTKMPVLDRKPEIAHFISVVPFEMHRRVPRFDGKFTDNRGKDFLFTGHLSDYN